MMRISILFVILACILQIAGCAFRSATPNRKFYGYASWYTEDDKWGKSTASGEEFDETKFTAAHRWLSFGKYVRVKRLDSDKTVVVKINDRGPYKWRRIIDLSPAAAKELDMIEIGITRVCVEILGKTPPE